MEFIKGGLELLTDSVFDEIGKICVDGFEVEGEGRVFDPDRFKKVIGSILELAPSVVFLLKDNLGQCHGALIGMVTPAVSTSDFIGTEFVWRVGPGGKGFGMELLRRFIDWCKEGGATQIVITGGHGEKARKHIAGRMRHLDFKPFVEYWIRKV